MAQWWAVVELADVGRWLRDYAGVLVAVATVVLVLVTARYVRLTHTLSTQAKAELDEMTKARLDARMPTVALEVSANYVAAKGCVEVLVRPKNHWAVSREPHYSLPRRLDSA